MQVQTDNPLRRRSLQERVLMAGPVSVYKVKAKPKPTAPAKKIISVKANLNTLAVTTNSPSQGILAAVPTLQENLNKVSGGASVIVPTMTTTGRSPAGAALSGPSLAVGHIMPSLGW